MYWLFVTGSVNSVHVTLLLFSKNTVRASPFIVSPLFSLTGIFFLNTLSVAYLSIK